jgi:ABC-type multidrug transport system ATPase subunit
MRHLTSDTLTESIIRILDLIGLSNDRTKLSKNLSGGMKRRLSIGMSLIGDPQVNRSRLVGEREVTSLMIVRLGSHS